MALGPATMSTDYVLRYVHKQTTWTKGLVGVTDKAILKRYIMDQDTQHCITRCYSYEDCHHTKDSTLQSWMYFTTLVVSFLASHFWNSELFKSIVVLEHAGPLLCCFIPGVIASLVDDTAFHMLCLAKLNCVHLQQEIVVTADIQKYEEVTNVC